MKSKPRTLAEALKKIAVLKREVEATRKRLVKDRDTMAASLTSECRALREMLREVENHSVDRRVWAPYALRFARELRALAPLLRRAKDELGDGDSDTCNALRALADELEARPE